MLAYIFWRAPYVDVDVLEYVLHDVVGRFRCPQQCGGQTGALEMSMQQFPAEQILKMVVFTTTCGPLRDE